jgi:uncharacterized protein (TIGR00369 family)
MTDARAAALARLRQVLEGPPFHQVLRPEAIDADPDRGTVAVRLCFRDNLARGKGEVAFHGGVIAALIDIAGHAAVAMKTGRIAPTIDLRVDYMRPSGGGALVAHAKLLKAGRTVARVDIEILDTEGRQIALGRGIFSTA